MRVVIEANVQRVGEVAAKILAAQVRRDPRSVLGLATGGTPCGCYRELIAIHQRDGLDFSQVRTFNLDEYWGISPDHPQSYHTFMRTELFQYLNLCPANCHLPRGDASDSIAESERYERAIRDAGGIDIQLLGLGRNGHIGFNEPGSSLASRTRVKHLARQTMDDNARYFGAPELVPRSAITMGVQTILDARHCLLLVTGATKASAIAAAVEGPVTAAIPASALQLHRQVTVILDEDAAAELRNREYYLLAEQGRRESSEYESPQH